MPAPPQQILAVTRPEPFVPLALVYVALVVQTPSGLITVDPADDTYMQGQVGSHFGSDYTSWRRIVASDLPTEYDWRNAWVDDGSAIRVDLPRAKNLRRAQISDSATSAHELLTTAILEAMSVPDEPRANELRAARDQLPTATSDPRIDAATTLTELAEVDPVTDILSGVGL